MRDINRPSESVRNEDQVWVDVTGLDDEFLSLFKYIIK